VTGRDGIVPPGQVLEDMGLEQPSPPAPEWVRAWIEAEASRPWPPMQE